MKTEKLMTIEFTPEKLAVYRKAYNKAVKTGQKSFIFEGSEHLVSYANYVIQYLETKLI